MTVPQAAERMGCSARFAWLLTARRELPTVRIGRLVRVRPEDLDRFCAERVDGGGELAARASSPAREVRRARPHRR
jgi:excisionase family DNA binding protein